MENATRKDEPNLAGWRRVRAGWYRRQTPDGGLWIHIVRRAFSGWSITANQDEFVVLRAPLRYGFETLADAKHAADQHWFKEARQ